MAQAFFRVRLAVRPKAGGSAEILAPKILDQVAWKYVIVKEGAEEGIVTADGTEDALANVAKDPACFKLNKEDVEASLKSYPSPSLKKKLRADEKDPQAVDTVQSVRAGFFIIDVPLVSPPP